MVSNTNMLETALAIGRMMLPMLFSRVARGGSQAGVSTAWVSASVFACLERQASPESELLSSGVSRSELRGRVGGSVRLRYTCSEDGGAVVSWGGRAWWMPAGWAVWVETTGASQLAGGRMKWSSVDGQIGLLCPELSRAELIGSGSCLEIPTRKYTNDSVGRAANPSPSFQDAVSSPPGWATGKLAAAAAAGANAVQRREDKHRRAGWRDG